MTPPGDERQGAWIPISAFNLWECPICHAAVAGARRADHDKWHSDESTAHMFGGF